jgi:hypothetical protein
MKYYDGLVLIQLIDLGHTFYHISSLPLFKLLLTLFALEYLNIRLLRSSRYSVEHGI